MTPHTFQRIFIKMIGIYFLSILLTGCDIYESKGVETPVDIKPTSITEDSQEDLPNEPEHGSGRMAGMHDRHHASIPDEYTDLENPIMLDSESLKRGEMIYTQNCLVCHGDTGMGDGELSPDLNPQPAPIAHTSNHMSDPYLFWRISEGGIPFETGMLSFETVLSVEDRWDVINYIRSLESTN